jgi:type VI secretion system protein ImpA
MDLAQPIEIEVLLAPLSEEAAVGSNPRQDFSPSSPFLRMKDARAEARRIERSIDMDGEGPSPNPSWQIVLDAGEEILSSHGKDLEVAAWMVESLVRLEGFAGLLSGLKLCQGLLDRYWDVVYPLPDEDGLSVRLSPFAGLNGQSEDSPLIQCLRKLPITGHSAPYSYWQYKKALETGSNTVSSPSDGFVSLEEFNAAVSSSPPSFFKQIVDLIHEILQALDALYNTFYGHVGADAPAVSGIINALQQVLEAIQQFAKKKLEIANEVSLTKPEEAADTVVGEEVVGGGVRMARGAPVDREAALGQLQIIARFFRETEPHSPISYTLEELVKRARLSLPDLLSELIVDDQARQYFFLATGMGLPKEEPES